MTILKRLPIFPLYYKGETKFTPIHCSDLTEIIYQIINQNINSKIIECIGPEVVTLKEILQRLSFIIGKKNFLIPVPLLIAKITCTLFELLPKPLITKDQLLLLKYDNIVSGKYKTNFELNLPSYADFNIEVEKYAFMWKEQGQFSKKNN